MIGYIKKGYELKRIIKIEYIDNEKDLDYVNSGRFDKGEPWERYKIKEFASYEEAINVFMCMSMRTDILDIRIYTQTLLNNEVIEEESIELEGLTIGTLYNNVSKDIKKQRDNAIEENQELKKVNAIHLDFLKKHNAEKEFNEYLKTI